MTIREVLQAIYERDQQLTPQAVVDELRPVGHPLHDRLTWDDSEAATAYRLLEARTLIRSVRVIYKEATDESAAERVRKFYAVRAPDGVSAYRTAEDIAEDPVTKELLLREMQRDIRALVRRYRQVEGFLDELAAVIPEVTAAA